MHIYCLLKLLSCCFGRFDNYYTITIALREFYAVMLDEIGYLQVLCNIVVYTLLCFSLLILFCISWSILHNVKSVFPNCQHGLVGGKLAVSQPVSVTQKIYKFYESKENRFKILEDENAAKRSLEQGEDPDLDNEGSIESREMADNYSVGNVSIVAENDFDDTRKVHNLLPNAAAIVAKVSPTPATLRGQHQDEQQGCGSDLSCFSKPENQHDGMLRQTGILQPVQGSFTLSRTPSRCIQGPEVALQPSAPDRSSENEAGSFSNGIGESTVNIGFGKQFDECIDAQEIQFANQCITEGRDKVSEPFQEARCNGEDCEDDTLHLDHGTQWMKADDSLLANQISKEIYPTGLERDVIDADQQVQSESLASLCGQEAYHKGPAPKLVMGFRPRKGSRQGQRRGSSASVILRGLENIVAAIRPSRTQSAGPKVGFAATPASGLPIPQAMSASFTTSPNTEQFMLLMSECSARGIVWYLRAGIHRAALTLVLALCICLWLVPVRNYPYYINTANIVRGFRRTGGDVMQAVFTTKELIIADGVSRANTSSLFNALTELRKNLYSDSEAFRKGGFIASERNTIRFGADQYNVAYYNAVMYQVSTMCPLDLF
jgi:hypothetical protein